MPALTAVDAAAGLIGPDDERTVGKRRLDALVDLLTGRQPLDLPRTSCPAGRASAAGSPSLGCGCVLGARVPCGAQLQVLVPLGAALGTTDELAELVGHGPLEPDLLAELLLAAPRMSVVFVDEDGVPVATDPGRWTAERGSPADVRRVLLQIAALPPPAQRHPRHPDDHDLPDSARSDAPSDLTGACPSDDASRLDFVPDGHPPDGLPPDVPPTVVAPTDVTRPDGLPAPLGRPRLRTRPHPVGTPGAYRVPARLRRFLVVRSPRCEWPGCGARATRCDQDHDRAWPAGPTCACNLGALCRRHHRVKQLGHLKRRRASGVFWTSPTGRTVLSPWQHEAPQSAVRPVPALPRRPHPLQLLSELELEQELYAMRPDAALFDDVGFSDRCDDPEPEQTGDALAERLAGDTRWTLDLQDSGSWHHPVDLDR